MVFSHPKKSLDARSGSSPVRLLEDISAHYVEGKLTLSAHSEPGTAPGGSNGNSLRGDKMHKQVAEIGRAHV